MTPSQTLQQDIQAQVAKGDLLDFQIVRATQGDVLYTLDFVKNKAIVRIEAKAHYVETNGQWVLTAVEPIDRQIEIIEPAQLE